MSWEKTTIGEHCTVTSSKRFHLSERSDSGVPFYCSKEIIQKVNGEPITECDYIREEAYERVKKQFGVPEVGDLLITTRGTYGVPYIYKNDDCFYFADGNLTWLKDFNEDLIPEYLYYWVRSYEGQKKIDAIAKGTAQKAVPIASIKMLEFDLPPIATQRKIVDTLSAYDSLIENNQKQIKLLEEAAQRLYKEWFVDLRFPGYETAPVVDGIPQGWKKGKIVDFFTTVLGGTPSREKSEYWGGDIPWINSGEVNKLRIIKESEFISELGLKKSATKLMPIHTTVLAITGATLGQVSYTEIETCANQSVVGIFDEDEQYSEYVYLAVYNEIKKIISKATGGAQQHINKDIVNNFEITLPTSSINNQLKRITEPLFKKITDCYFAIESLTESRDRLLPKLMSGEIEV